MLPSSLQISVVTHRPDLKLLERCLRKLAPAEGKFERAGWNPFELPAEAKQVATQEVERLQQMPPAAEEYGVS